MVTKYCTRCKKYHNSPPVDEKKLIEKHASDIAREIDLEVIESLKSIHKGANSSSYQNGSMRVSKTDRKGDKGVQ
jgi:hypothetical protein